MAPSSVRVRSGQPGVLSSSSGTVEEFCFRTMGSCADGASEQRADGEELADVMKPTDSMLSDVEGEDISS